MGNKCDDDACDREPTVCLPGGDRKADGDDQHRREPHVAPSLEYPAVLPDLLDEPDHESEREITDHRRDASPARDLEPERFATGQSPREIKRAEDRKHA